MPSKHTIFVTGGTGYIGSRLIPELLARGHVVRVLVRPGSERKLPWGATPIQGNALDGSSYVDSIHPADTFAHLVGVSLPSPAKAKEFRSINYVAATKAFDAAASSGIRHFVYLSVAHPAPTMKCDGMRNPSWEDRNECHIMRPWYVLGPGHWWPYLLVPVYLLSKVIPSTRESAQGLGLVTIKQMIQSLVWAIEHPAEGTLALAVEDIKHRRP